MIKSKLMLIAVAFASASLLFVSCGSTPAAEPAPVESEKTEEPATETAEENQEAEVQEEKNEEEAADSNAEDTSALEEKLNSLWEKIDSSRNGAIDSGAKNLVPKAFGLAEEEYNRLKGSDAGLEELEALNRRYDALKALADAKSKKDKIDEMDLASYRQNEYDRGSALIDELSSEESENAVPQSEWEEKAFDADGAMTAVLETGLKARAAEERTLAIKAQKKANSIKCYVSRKTEYDSLVKTFKEGDVEYVTKNSEGALERYIKAKVGFEALFEEVSEARAKAQSAIDEAKKRVEASENTAVQADIEKPLGDEPVEGIEEAETKLLEDDDYSKSEESEVELSEEVPEDMEEIEEVPAVEEADVAAEKAESVEKKDDVAADSDKENSRNEAVEVKAEEPVDETPEMENSVEESSEAEVEEADVESTGEDVQESTEQEAE